MNSSAVQYVGFIVAALILTWAAIEINRRYFRRRRVDARSFNTWVHLDTGQPDVTEESLPASHDDGDTGTNDSGEQNLQTRARQNGYYSESKKPL